MPLLIGFIEGDKVFETLNRSYHWGFMNYSLFFLWNIIDKMHFTNNHVYIWGL